MNKAQVRVVDPVLSNVALGYKNLEFVGSILFPFVEIAKSGVRLIKFGKESFIKYNMRRAPGADVAEIQFGYASDPVALVQDSIAAKVPREWLRESSDLPTVQMETTAVNNAMRVMMLGLEFEQAEIACDAANYGANNKVTLGAGEHWDDGGDPGANIREWKAAVRDQIGASPNTLVLTSDDWDVLAENPIVKDRFKYTSADSLTEEMAARYFQVQNVVHASALMAANEDAALEKIWTASVLAYVPPESERSMGTPAYGYTYRLQDHPLVEEGYFRKRNKSWIYPMEYERRPYQTSMSAGFHIQGIKAP
jgi:hypothetical protein